MMTAYNIHSNWNPALCSVHKWKQFSLNPITQGMLPITRECRDQYNLNINTIMKVQTSNLILSIM